MGWGGGWTDGVMGGWRVVRPRPMAETEAAEVGRAPPRPPTAQVAVVDGVPHARVAQAACVRGALVTTAFTLGRSSLLEWLPPLASAAAADCAPTPVETGAGEECAPGPGACTPLDCGCGLAGALLCTARRGGPCAMPPPRLAPPPPPQPAAVRAPRGVEASAGSWAPPGAHEPGGAREALEHCGLADVRGGW